MEKINPVNSEGGGNGRQEVGKKITSPTFFLTFFVLEMLLVKIERK